jgi:hypothetical protein
MTDENAPDNAPDQAQQQEYDWSNDPDGLTLEEAQPKDRYLNVLLTFFLGTHDDAVEGSLGLTLFTTGGIVSGTAISRKAWINGNLESLSENMSEDARSTMEAIDTVFNGISDRASQFSKRRDEQDLPLPARRFIHLKDVRFGVGENTVNAPYWRGELAAVSGWTLGSHSAN